MCGCAVGKGTEGEPTREGAARRRSNLRPRVLPVIVIIVRRSNRCEWGKEKATN